jgi:hypothetical protein
MRMIFLLKPTCHERTPLNIGGPPLKNPQLIFIMKTVPESVEVEFLWRKLISGSIREMDTNWWLKRRTTSCASIRCKKPPS